MTETEIKAAEEFFYNSYSRVWPHAGHKDMFDIYNREFDRLLDAVEKDKPYLQEFAQDYTLAAKLRSKAGVKKSVSSLKPTDARSVSPFYVPPNADNIPYSILFLKDKTVFRYYGNDVLKIPYADFFELLRCQSVLLALTVMRSSFTAEDYDESYFILKEELRNFAENYPAPQITLRLSAADSEVLYALRRRFEAIDLSENRQCELAEKLKLYEQEPERFKRAVQIKGDPFSSFEGSVKLTLKQGDLVSFRQLKCADTLCTLTADDLEDYTDIDALGEYVKIRSLALRNMHLKDIAFVSGMKGLDELIIARNDVTDLSPLAGLPITHLYIAGNPVRDLSVLSTLNRLKNVYTDEEQVRNYKVCHKGTMHVLRLTPLKISVDRDGRITSSFTADIVRKIQGNKRQQKVTASLLSEAGKNVGRHNAVCSAENQDPRKLQIKDRFLFSGICNSLGHMPAVKYDLLKLKNLDCSDSIPLQPDHDFLDEYGDFSCLADAVNLVSLNLSGRKVDSFAFLEKCVKLKKLNLSNSNVNSLSFLRSLKHLITLDITGCSELKIDRDLLQILSEIKNVYADEHCLVACIYDWIKESEYVLKLYPYDRQRKLTLHKDLRVFFPSFGRSTSYELIRAVFISVSSLKGSDGSVSFTLLSVSDTETAMLPVPWRNADERQKVYLEAYDAFVSERDRLLSELAEMLKDEPESAQQNIDEEYIRDILSDYEDLPYDAELQDIVCNFSAEEREMFTELQSLEAPKSNENPICYEIFPFLRFEKDGRVGFVAMKYRGGSLCVINEDASVRADLSFNPVALLSDLNVRVNEAAALL